MPTVWVVRARADEQLPGSARLGSARLGSARLGSARLGSARLGSARLGNHDWVAVLHVKPVAGFSSLIVFGPPGRPGRNDGGVYARYVAVVNRVIFQGKSHAHINSLHSIIILI
jgi:hypothetical protein